LINGVNISLSFQEHASCLRSHPDLLPIFQETVDDMVASIRGQRISTGSRWGIRRS
jgi:hypothetical protein